MLFGRRVIFEMYPEGSLEGFSWEGLAMTFTAEKNVRGRGKGVIQVLNLTREERALAERRGTTFRVRAGYDVPGVVLEGQAIKGGVSTPKTEADQFLQVEVRDGGRQSELARVDVSIATGTTLREVIEITAGALGLPIAEFKLPATADQQLPNGINLSGPAWQVLQRLCDSISADVATIDGAIQILDREETTTSIEAPILSPLLGTLVGEPTQKDGGRVELVSFLSPKFQPGGLVQCRDVPRFDGDWKIESLRHDGDSGFAAPYYTTLTARRLQPR